MSAPPWIIGLCVVLWSAAALAAEPEVSDAEMPRFPAVEVRDAVGTFRVRPGFKVEVAAAEPQVVSPVAMAFDEDGRLFVVEMRDYSERRDEKLGRIRMLEDVDGDGVYEKSTVFAEGLGWPTAVFPWDGGVFVGCTPDVLYLKDTDGDGKADVRRVVLTGFADGVARVNVQGLLNSFNWGLDNRVHGASSSNGGRVRVVGQDDGKAIDLRGAKGFAFDPRAGTLVAENGGGQHGISFDDWGRLFVCSNSHHIQTFMYDGAYADRGRGAALPAGLVDIAADGPAAEVYRASPEEPWRVIRTKWRVSGVSKGIVEGGGRSAGYFTGATGLTIYRGDAYGPSYVGDAFIGDAGGNLVHRKKVRVDGLNVIAERAADELKSEFIASTDTWFRPVQFANGPDGCLYVIDMYRQTIEHPWSLPEALKKHLDLNAGNDRGRIYRVVPDGFKRPGKVALGKATTAELIRALAHPNGWHRDTAARLLYQRQDAAAVPLLEKVIATAGADRAGALGAMHAMYALDGLGALKAGDVLAGMGHADEHVRAHAVKLAERFIAAADGPAELVKKLDAMTEDPSLAVRYRVAFSLGARADDELAARLARVAARGPADPWLMAAVLSSAAGERAAELFKLLDEPGRRESPAARALSVRLAEVIGRRMFGDEIAAVIESAAAEKDDSRTMAVARALGAGLRPGGVAIEEEKASAVIARAVALAGDAAAADAEARLSAIAVLGYTSWEHHAADLLPLLDPRQGQAVQVAALGALEVIDRGELAEAIVERWATFTPGVREAAAGVMVKRPARAAALLGAIRAKAIRAGDLSGAQAAALRQSSDAGVRAVAKEVLAAPAGRRAEVVKAYEKAVEMVGDAKRGHAIYAARCAACHRIGGEGSALGPDLESVKNAGRARLLESVLDPNREVAPSYAAYVVETREGDTHIGLIAAETASAVTLKTGGGAQEVIAREGIKAMRTTGLSMMPEGLEEGLKAQDLADLLEFIGGR